MIKINGDEIDLILQVEESADINKIISKLTLDTYGILIIAPKVFVERFVQFNYETSEFDTTNWLDRIEKSIQENDGYLSFISVIKGKQFDWHFFITDSKRKIVSNPFKGEQVFKVGIKTIEI